MSNFLQQWHDAATTSLGFFWMALWAFSLGYLISSLIQVLVTRHRMQQLMGKSGAKSVAMGTFFGFISSSCSFAALSTTRALFQKGAGLIPALAFMLSSTNLVIELGIVIALFLSWQFVAGEYVGGLLLILFVWMAVSFFYPARMIKKARGRLEEQHHHNGSGDTNWRQKITSKSGWREIAGTYVMEWQMVWKDVLIGFTVAGIIASFVPHTVFKALFIGSGIEQAGQPGFFSILLQTLAGPVVAFFTFIGSMGNIPLAAVLYDNGVSFAGVMAFIFSDLVVLPVLRINALYYGWKMALYILLLLLSGLIFVSLFMHYGLSLFDLLPHPGDGRAITDRDHFAINYGFFMNIIFLVVSAVLAGLWWTGRHTGHSHEHADHSGGTSVTDVILVGLVMLSVCWLAGGVFLAPLFA